MSFYYKRQRRRRWKQKKGGKIKVGADVDDNVVTNNEAKIAANADTYEDTCDTRVATTPQTEPMSLGVPMWVSMWVSMTLLKACIIAAKLVVYVNLRMQVAWLRVGVQRPVTYVCRHLSRALGTETLLCLLVLSFWDATVRDWYCSRVGGRFRVHYAA